MREDRDDSEADTRKNSIIADSEVPVHAELPLMPALPTSRNKPPTNNKDLSDMLSKATVLSDEESHIKINPMNATVTLSND